MKCFYRELSRRKKYLITELNNKIATLEWQWFQREISDKDYVVAYDDSQNYRNFIKVHDYQKNK